MWFKLLGNDFFEKFPIFIFHRTHHQEGTVVALFTNPRVAEGIYAVSEKGLYDAIVEALEHQRHYPMDNHNAINLQVNKRALRELQAEKIRYGLPLDAPQPVGSEYLTILDCI